jgi:hypothetical protein
MMGLLGLFFSCGVLLEPSGIRDTIIIYCSTSYASSYFYVKNKKWTYNYLYLT